MIDGSRDITGALHRLELSLARNRLDAEPVRAAAVDIDASLCELHDWAERSSADPVGDVGDADLAADNDVTLWFPFNDPSATSRLEGQRVNAEPEVNVDIDEVVEPIQPQGDGLIRETSVTEVSPAGVRPVVSEHLGRIGAEPDSVGQLNDDGGEELVVVIDDRDSTEPNSRGKGWLNLRRADRRATKLASHDDRVSERMGRVLSSSNGIKDLDPDEVEARIRNLSHGTNSE